MIENEREGASKTGQIKRVGSASMIKTDDCLSGTHLPTFVMQKLLDL
jgi:hypothetical protein